MTHVWVGVTAAMGLMKAYQFLCPKCCAMFYILVSCFLFGYLYTHLSEGNLDEAEVWSKEVLPWVTDCWHVVGHSSEASLGGPLLTCETFVRL